MIQKYKYKEDELKRIGMKNCRYFALAINEAGNHIGVILFESTNSDNFSDGTKKNISDYHTKYQSDLCAFVRKRQEYDRVLSVNPRTNGSASAKNDFLLHKHQTERSPNE